MNAITGGFRVAVEVLAKPETIFRIHEVPQLKRQWLFERTGAICLSFSSDFRSGGYERAVYRLDDAALFDVETAFGEITPHREIRSSHRVDENGRPSALAHRRLILTPTITGTQVRIDQEVTFFDGNDQLEHYEGRTRRLLDHLDALAQKIEAAGDF